jgi:amphi-Trp domain-containing protein
MTPPVRPGRVARTLSVEAVQQMMSETDDSESADESETERTVIRMGREFEQEYRLDASEAGAFLVDLGEQLQAGDKLTITTDEWELPFAFGEPVELEIDFEGVGDPELEIEVELPGRTDESAPDVE